MIQENKDLLLNYLCMALPYDVKVLYDNNVFDIDYICPLYEGVKLDNTDNYTRSISRVKPYLRSMSSMTEKDCLSLSKELNLSIRARGGDIYFPHNKDNTLENWNKVNNWLLKNHFDFMGLIPKGLAIEVTETNNIYKD